MSRRFLKSSDVYNSVNAPNWTDTEGFYKRVHWLATECHASSNDDDSVEDYFMALEQLHIEIYGAITNLNDRNNLEETRKTVQSLVYDPKNSSKHLAIKREMVRPYHILLTFYCHKYGLFLRKTLKETLDDWEEEQYSEGADYEKSTITRTNNQDTQRQPLTIQKPRL